MLRTLFPFHGNHFDIRIRHNLQCENANNMQQSDPCKYLHFYLQMTWADIHLLVRREFLDRDKVEMNVDWTKFPKLVALMDRVAKHPKIAAWIAKTHKFVIIVVCNGILQ